MKGSVSTALPEPAGLASLAPRALPLPPGKRLRPHGDDTARQRQKCENCGRNQKAHGADYCIGSKLIVREPPRRVKAGAGAFLASPHPEQRAKRRWLNRGCRPDEPPHSDSSGHGGARHIRRDRWAPAADRGDLHLRTVDTEKRET